MEEKNKTYDLFYMLTLKNDVRPSDVSKETGISSTVFSEWKKGKSQPKIDKLAKIAEYFGVPLEYFTGKEPGRPEPSTDATRWIPVLGRVAAGIPAEMVEDVLGFEEVDNSVGEAFALVINGDSMEPALMKGDVVIVKRQEDVESGAVAIVAVNGEDATCKKIVKSEDGVILQPLNPAYPPVFFSNEDILAKPITILGRVVEIRRKL